MRKEPQAVYRNKSDQDVSVEIGEVPGEKPRRWDCPAGGTVEGPANYAEAFARSGLALERRIEPAFDLPSDRVLTRAEVEKASEMAERLFNDQRQEIRRLQDQVDGAAKHEADLVKEAAELRAKVDALTAENGELRAKATASGTDKSPSVDKPVETKPKAK